MNFEEKREKNEKINLLSNFMHSFKLIRLDFILKLISFSEPLSIGFLFWSFFKKFLAEKANGLTCYYCLLCTTYNASNTLTCGSSVTTASTVAAAVAASTTTGPTVTTATTATTTTATTTTTTTTPSTTSAISSSYSCSVNI